jgi:hypothetical protein
MCLVDRPLCACLPCFPTGSTTTKDNGTSQTNSAKNHRRQSAGKAHERSPLLRLLRTAQQLDPLLVRARPHCCCRCCRTAHSDVTKELSIQSIAQNGADQVGHQTAVSVELRTSLPLNRADCGPLVLLLLLLRRADAVTVQAQSCVLPKRSSSSQRLCWPADGCAFVVLLSVRVC